jgi:hypothetical protein
MTNKLKNLLTVSRRRVARSQLRSDISQKLMVNTLVTLQRSSELLTKPRTKREVSDTPHPTKGKGKGLRSSAQHCRYSLFVTCNKCGRIHNTGFSVMLQEGPNKRQSLAELYDGSPPESLSNLAATRMTCPFTGKQFSQNNYSRIFLMPARRGEAEPS